MEAGDKTPCIQGSVLRPGRFTHKKKYFLPSLRVHLDVLEWIEKFYHGCNSNIGSRFPYSVLITILTDHGSLHIYTKWAKYFNRDEVCEISISLTRSLIDIFHREGMSSFICMVYVCLQEESHSMLDDNIVFFNASSKRDRLQLHWVCKQRNKRDAPGFSALTSGFGNPTSALSGKFSFLRRIQKRERKFYRCVGNFRNCQKSNTLLELRKPMDGIDVLKHKDFRQVLICCLLLIEMTCIPSTNKHSDGREGYRVLHASYRNIRTLDSSVV